MQRTSKQDHKHHTVLPGYDAMQAVDARDRIVKAITDPCHRSFRLLYSRTQLGMHMHTRTTFLNTAYRLDIDHYQHLSQSCIHRCHHDHEHHT